MSPIEKIEDRIWNLKNEIHEIKEYIISDYCQQCSKMYAKLYNLESELKVLQDERDRVSEAS
jgi:hypothetical protein